MERSIFIVLTNQGRSFCHKLYPLRRDRRNVPDKLILPNYGEAPEDIADIGKGVKMYEETHR